MARLNLKEINRQLFLATQDIAPENVAKELASYAKRSLSEVIQSGEGSDIYERYVNGRFGASEESVRPPGPIVYIFNWWKEIIEFGIAALVQRSPEKSGRYKRSWFAMVDGRHVVDFDRLPTGAVVYLTNNQPYSRKIEVGHMRMSVPPGVVEDCALTIKRRFANTYDIKATMITHPNGYILKGVFSRGIRPQARKKLRKDTRAGSVMTYPSIRLEMRS
jgi:hypothetical protein